MNDSHLTASAVVSFSQDLERRAAEFYEVLERHFPEHVVALRDFALVCIKTSVEVIRTYQETVSDALETGFSFSGISLSDYRIDLILPESPTWDEALQMARALEDTASAFYQDAATSSEGLLASIQRTFKRAARSHQKQREALERLSRP